MLLHPLLLDSKVFVLETMLADTDLAFGDLPGAREASIQLAKLKKMASQYKTKFPLEAILVGPEKKKNLDKARGEFKRRLGRQNKLVSLVRRGNKPHIVRGTFRVTRNRGGCRLIFSSMNRSAGHDVMLSRVSPDIELPLHLIR